jgi:multiple sugar transport system permease protein
MATAIIAPEPNFYRQQRARRSVLRVFAYVVTTLMAIAFAFPFLWLVSASLKSANELARFPPTFIPNPAMWENYAIALRSQPFDRYFANSIMFSAGAIIGHLFSATLVAYGFSRIRFPGRDVIFVLVLSTVMLPSQVVMIPQYILFRELGWLDSLKPLIVPTFFGGAFYIFLLRQFFMSIPQELDEAALMDGANRFDIYWRIILPLSRPILVTVVAFVFIGTWNDFLGPLIYLSTRNNMTVALGLLQFRGEGAIMNLLMAASVVALAPIVTIFFFAQRYFIAGITLTGMKEG